MNCLYLIHIYVVGILCSLLGLGGAELMAPVLLSLKVLPVVSSATTSMLSLLFSSSSLVHIALASYVDYSSGIVVFMIGICGGLSGRMLALYILQKYKRGSFICFTLTIVLVIGLCLLVYEASEEEADWTVHPLCPSPPILPIQVPIKPVITE